MDTLVEKVKRVAQSYVRPSLNGEIIPTFDDVYKSYAIFGIGDIAGKQYYSVILHLRVVDGRVQIEEHTTNADIIEDLVHEGIPRDLIDYHHYEKELKISPAMESLVQKVKGVVQSYVRPAINGRMLPTFDDEHQSYAVFSSAEIQGKRYYHVVLHIRVEWNHVIIEAHNTDADIIADLEAEGIPRDMITYHHPTRQPAPEPSAG